MNTRKLRSFAILFLISVIGLVSTACTIANKSEVAQANKPVVTVNIPLTEAGAILGDNVTIQVIAIDTKGISRVELSIDGKPYATMVAAPDSTSFSGAQSWTPETIGNHVVQAQAFNIDEVAGDAVQSFVIVNAKDDTQGSQSAEAVAETATEVPPTATEVVNDTLPTATTMPPTNTAVPPTNTAVPPTNTPIPPTATNTMVLADPPQPLPNIYSFSANKYTIDWNEEVTLQWALDGAEWAHLKYENELGATGEYGVVAPGSETIKLTSTTTYTLIAHNASGDTTAEIVVNVNPLIIAPIFPTVIVVPLATPTPAIVFPLPTGIAIPTIVIPGF